MDCASCGWPLDDSPYTMKWEDGDNEYGYWTCRYCGYEHEDYSDDD